MGGPVRTIGHEPCKSPHISTGRWEPELHQRSARTTTGAKEGVQTDETADEECAGKERGPRGKKVKRGPYGGEKKTRAILAEKVRTSGKKTGRPKKRHFRNPGKRLLPTRTYRRKKRSRSLIKKKGNSTGGFQGKKCPIQRGELTFGVSSKPMEKQKRGDPKNIDLGRAGRKGQWGLFGTINGHNEERKSVLKTGTFSEKMRGLTVRKSVGDERKKGFMAPSGNATPEKKHRMGGCLERGRN